MSTVLAADSASSINSLLITSATTVIVALIGTLGASFKRHDEEDDYLPPPCPEPDPPALPTPPLPTPPPPPEPPPAQGDWATLVKRRDEEILRLSGVLSRNGIDPSTGRKIRPRRPKDTP